MITGEFPYQRKRRLRQSNFIRNLVAENQLSTNDLILPVFVKEGLADKEVIKAMPNVYRWGIDSLIPYLETIHHDGINAIALFPIIDSNKKSHQAEAAYDDDGLVPKTIKQIKQHLPNLGIITDIALDPYTLSGQDGIIDNNGYILNDTTTDVLVKQALCHAKAGADIVAPSDMMDGRIRVIREALEKKSHTNTMILSYAAKYASYFYGPFREAVASSDCLGSADKKTYQMNYANANEALHEIGLDINEGADMVMIKPGMPYLDIVRQTKQQFKIPTFAYQVSGEYAMLKAASQNGWLDEKSTVLESLLCFKRAGCDGVLSYYADRAAKWLKE